MGFIEIKEILEERGFNADDSRLRFEVLIFGIS
jgi:hypothetical protein